MKTTEPIPATTELKKDEQTSSTELTTSEISPPKEAIKSPFASDEKDSPAAATAIPAGMFI